MWNQCGLRGRKLSGRADIYINEYIYSRGSKVNRHNGRRVTAGMDCSAGAPAWPGTQLDASQPSAPRVAARESGLSIDGFQGRSLRTMRPTKVSPRSYETAIVRSTSRAPPGVLGPYS